MKLAFHPLTPDRWDDLERLFGPRGACGGCWCMYWRRTGAEWRACDAKANRRDFRALVARGPAPGILAYEGGEPVGWCALAPREDYPRFRASRTLKPVDDAPVWSVSCFFVRRDRRRQGVTRSLLEAAKRHVRASGGRIVEGYPVVPKGGSIPEAFAWTGVLPAFESAGFEEVARPGARAIVRFALARR